MGKKESNILARKKKRIPYLETTDACMYRCQ